MKKRTVNIVLLLASVLVVVLALWGPETLAVYKDRSVLNQITEQEAEREGIGYRYQLNNNEKLYLLSESLNSQSLPQTEQSALISNTAEGNYQEGAYAFVVNRKGPTGAEITDQEIYDSCNQGISLLQEKGIIPKDVKAIESSYYDTTMYSAIDVLEPRNNVAVWKLTFLENRKNVSRQNRLLDVCIDADTGKIYEFYVRTDLTWDEIDEQELVSGWAEYIGLYGMEEYVTENPLLETTPYYKKYVFPGMGEEKTLVTVGFYEGINELFLKISR